MKKKEPKVCRRCKQDFVPSEADPERCDNCFAPDIPASYNSQDDTGEE